MFKKLQQRFYKKRIENNLHRRDISHINSPLKTLAFLVDEDDCKDVEVLHKTAEVFGIASQNITIFGYKTFEKKAPSMRQNQITSKDFSWAGNITNSLANDFLNISFDVLVGFYKGRHMYLDLLVSESAAKFKVGALGADDRLYDLIISIPPQQQELYIKELKKYLTVLNKI